MASKRKFFHTCTKTAHVVFANTWNSLARKAHLTSLSDGTTWPLAGAGSSAPEVDRESRIALVNERPRDRVDALSLVAWHANSATGSTSISKPIRI
jgi:hypothetical protein